MTWGIPSIYTSIEISNVKVGVKKVIILILHRTYIKVLKTLWHVRVHIRP